VSETIDLLPIAVYRSTPEGRLVDVNPAMVAMLGFAGRDELLATPAVELYADPDDRERILARAQREGQLRGIETQLRRRDGKVIWGRLNTFLERGAGGRTLFYVGTIEDVTERRLAEEALWESEARSRMLLEQLPAVLWTTDSELRSTLSEGAGLKALNLRPNELTGTRLEDYLGKDELGRAALEAHRRALQGEAHSYRQVWGGRTYEAHVRPLYGPDRTIVGTLGMALDITDLQRRAG
jgi:PAS domain S-box-containing protein